MPPETEGGKAFRRVIAEVHFNAQPEIIEPRYFRAGRLTWVDVCGKQGKPVVFDGAMGSTLYEEGILHTRAFEECNISAAAKVKKVHRAYLEAGANVIE